METREIEEGRCAHHVEQREYWISDRLCENVILEVMEMIEP